MKYDYNLDLSNIHPTIKEKINSSQFPLSEKILDKRMELGYSYERMAEISNTALETFIKMENSDTSINVEDYVDVLFNIEIYEAQIKKPNENKYLNNDEVTIEFNNKKYKIDLSGGEKCQLLAA